MEMVDIIDKNLKVLYSTSKADAHTKGLLHKTVIAEIINSKGEFMLIKPFSHKQDAGQFVSPVGGHVRTGETDEEALKREVEEEVGIKPPYKFSLKGKAIYNREVLGRKENHYFIVYEIFTDQEPKLGDEAQSYQRFSVVDLKEALRNSPDDFGAAYHFVVSTLYSEFILS